MRIFVKAKPGVKKAYVKETTDLFAGIGGNSKDRHFIVAVHERADLDQDRNRGTCGTSDIGWGHWPAKGRSI